MGMEGRAFGPGAFTASQLSGGRSLTVDRDLGTD